MARARSGAPFDLMLPDHSKANEGSIASVWDCPGNGVAILFDSGIATFQSRNSLEDPQGVFERMAEEYPEFSVGSIRGVPAQFSDPTKSENGTAAGGVDWVENGMRYTVSGDGSMPLEELREVAVSFRRYR